MTSKDGCAPSADAAAADLLRKRIEQRLPGVTTRPMFGYQCYLVQGKFFAGFGKRRGGEQTIIIRLPKDLQSRAVAAGLRPFRHGARAGWMEMDCKSTKGDDAFVWIRKGYDYAASLVRGDNGHRG